MEGVGIGAVRTGAEMRISYVMVAAVGLLAFDASAQKACETNYTKTGSFFAGRTFTLTAYRNNSPLDNFTFQQPVTLVIDYTDSDVAGIDENSLTLFFYDETNGIWSDQGIIVVARDPANNRLTVQIPHLTEFAMGVSKRFYLPVVTR